MILPSILWYFILLVYANSDGIVYCRDVVRIDPLHNESWQMLGMILAEDGRHDEALECFETASSLDSSTPLIPFTAIPLVIRSS